ncbi:hypothetical protein OE88DRAFT_387812 [Heliocybe sulcata]|uniref:Uncharacterized protein n=1 Tax=Heliocybe sulcata TaxID=5364 RepID=A0A5C3MY40_9AGAM|nr:hypothetical protein OE88DRAFT_387812 [Heliocybe sulcata]
MSSSQSLRPQYPVTGQRATAKASEGGRGIIGQHSRRSHLRVLEKRLESPHTIIPDDFRNLVADLRAVVSLYLQDQENFVIDEAYLHLEFPSVADLSRPIELGIASYRQFGACYNKHRHPKPSPSDYALHWASQGVPSLLCGRPPDRHGPPLSTLHDVFREFIVRVGSPLPLGCPRAIQAQRAAVSLCRWMGESFVDQTSRSTKFDDCVRGLFPEWRNQRQLKPPDEVCTGYVDRTLESVDGRIFVFREDRRDIGQDRRRGRWFSGILGMRARPYLDCVGCSLGRG